MTKCPSCGHDNIGGEDRCTVCFHSLMNADLPKPIKGDVIQNVMMRSPIAEFVTGRDLLVASPEDTMDKVIKLFQDEKKSCLVVYKNKKLVGILSHRDILKKVAAIHEDFSTVKVESIMTANPEYVKTEDRVAFVINKMALGGFRHVPVLASDGTPLGIISIQDVLSYLARVS